MTNITLRPGDYVRTKGMTEEQYHAVAKAFIAAGAGDGDWDLQERMAVFGWHLGRGATGLLFQATPNLFSRQLTIDQILGTEPDADGWIEWHGGDCPVGGEAAVDAKTRCGAILRQTECAPLVWGHLGSGGDIIAYRIHQPEQEEAPMTIEQLLTKANKHAEKAQEHREKAAKHERKVDKHEAERVELVKQARQLMPGYTLEISAEWERDVEDQPTEHMADPTNWKAGDVVECVEEAECFTVGNQYKVRATDGSDMYRYGDAGGDMWEQNKHFRWISRPVSEGGE